MDRHVNPEDPDLYALGALDGEEKRAFEAHVRDCAVCAAELDAARERMALLGLAVSPAAPPASVREDLLRRAREDRPREERGQAAHQPLLVSMPGSSRQAPQRRWMWLTPALATAAIVFALIAGWLWTRNQQYARQLQALKAQLSVTQSHTAEMASAAAETNRLLGMPGTMRVALAQQPGGAQGKAGARAGLLYNPHMGMVMCAGQLEPAPAGKSYQLWLVPMKGDPVSVAVFSWADPSQPMMAHVPPGMEAKAFAVTVEPQGGMPQPTGPQVLMGQPS